MTNEDRREAFDLRLAGYTWEEIGERLGYAANTVERDLRRCMTRSGQCLDRVVYPALRHYISYHHQGSVSAFCEAVGVSRNRGGAILRGEQPMGEDFLRQAEDRTGLRTNELTRREEEHGTMAV